MAKRRFRAGIWVLVLLLLVPVIFFSCEHVRGRVALSRYRKQLVAEGLKISPTDFHRQSPAGENGAKAILEASRRLQSGRVLPNHYAPRMMVLDSGRAVAGFREEDWVDSKLTNHWEDLAADVATNREVLNEIQAELQKPVLDFELDFAGGPKMLLPHLAPAKQLEHWFGGAAQLALRRGDTPEALKCLLTQVELTRLVAADHIAISELVRIAMAGIARAYTWEALQADGWTDDQLASLQAAWDKVRFAEPMARAMEGELVFSQVGYVMARDSNAGAADIIFGLDGIFGERPAWEQRMREMPGGEQVADFLKRQVYCRVWRFAWLDQAELRYLQQVAALVEFNRAAARSNSFAAVNPELEKFMAACARKNGYDQLRYPDSGSPFSLFRCILRAMHAETESSLTVCAIALKRYSLRHGKLPETLGALAPDFLSRVPIDYLDGQPLRYQLREDGGFTLYSVGDNLIDEHGDASIDPGKSGLDSLRNRKDLIWPEAALGEELRVWRLNAQKGRN